jgi:2-polyprenyl-6-methoxyphenol hydroxylase-like FAD-dependent oxidoreductase
MTKARTALIVGGGIAGSVAAMALHRAGIQATVYEAYDGPADGVGGMLGLAPNGLNALGVIGLDDAIHRIAIPVSSMIMQSWTGKRLAQFGTESGPPIMHVVWRAELHRMLADEVARRGIAIEYGHRLVGATSGAGGVTATFADGSQASADLLIGADGIRSAVRSLIDPGAPAPGYTGLLGFGGWASGGLPSTSDNVMHMSFGKRAFFSHSVVGARTGWFVNLPTKRPMTLTEANAVGADSWLRELAGAFNGDRLPAQEIISRTDPADLVVVGALEILPSVPTWHRDRMVLIGDAAHAPSPSSGQGASQAIESAIQLARCLRDLPVGEAFAAYERLRRPRIDRIVAMAKRTNSSKAAGPVARVLRDLLMPVTMKLLAKPDRMAWLTEFRIDWPAPAAVGP